MKQAIVFFFTLVTAIGLYAQDCDQIWHQFDASSSSETGEDMAVDGAGNVFVSASTSSGSSVYKFDAAGNMQWSNSNSNNSEETVDISLDNNGNVVVSGYHWRISTGNPVGDSVWIAKYTPTGSLMWRQSFPVFMFQIFSFNHLCTHAHGSNGEIYLAADDQGELLLYKFSSNGNLVWTRTAGTAGSDYPTAMETSGDGRILLTSSGTTSGPVYATVFDSNGNQVWEAFEGQNYDGANDAHFVDNGEVEVLTASFNNGTRDITLLTYNNNGTLVNTKSYDTGVSEFPKSFIRSSGGEYYFRCQATQTSGFPYTDWLTVKGDASGNVLWSDRYDGTTGDDELPRDMHLGADGQLYVTGTGGPRYPQVPTGLLKRSMVTVKYAPANGNRICTIINQDESPDGQRVISRSNGNFYILGDGDRDLYKYGNNTTPPPTCDTPTGLTASNITDNSAELSWTAVTGAQSYDVRYRPQGASAWTMQNTANTTITINGLMAEMPYEWQVATVCSASSSPFSASSTFTTAADPGNGGGGPCAATATAAFPDNPLTTVNDNVSSTTYDLENGSQNPTFTISDMDKFGSDGRGYLDKVTVTYINGNGVEIEYGVFYGDTQNEVDVSIDGFVDQITVSLVNGYDTFLDFTLSVDFSPISYCPNQPLCPDGDDDQDGICNSNDVCPAFDDNLIGTPCDDGDPCTTGDVYTSTCSCQGTYSDSDQDGVCDANDICQGGDDNVDSNQNGIPDYCECAPEVGQFPENPLTHAGAGSNSTTYNFPPNSKQVSFSVFNINEATRLFYSYDEKVTITYVDAAGTTQLYGTYLGSQVSTANVDISGFVQSVTVSLENALDENSNLPMSVSMSDIDYCVETFNLQESPQGPNGLPEQNRVGVTRPMDFSLWPNPAKNKASISFSRTPKPGSEVLVKNSLGQDIARYQLGTARQYSLSPQEWNTQSRLVWVVLLEPGFKPAVKRLVVIR